jgi:glucose/arabinose dehydrogenase
VKGKIHRVMDDGSIPADNPYANTPGARPTIWCNGNRNPQGLIYDLPSGILWETEHGPRGGDELNIIRKGLNYGWPTITYGINYSGTPITDHTSQDGMEQPITYWTPSLGASGLAVYHGDKFPQWEGNIFAGALALTKIVRVKLDGQKVVEQEDILKGTGRIRDLRVFDDGYLYVVYDNPGKVIRLVPSN